jgi:hypothetical protein
VSDRADELRRWSCYFEDNRGLTRVLKAGADEIDRLEAALAAAKRERDEARGAARPASPGAIVWRNGSHVPETGWYWRRDNRRGQVWISTMFYEGSYPPADDWAGPIPEPVGRDGEEGKS